MRLFKLALLSSSLFFCVSAEICPNITALYNVSAHFNFDLDSFTEYEESINFYQLENHTVIHVVQANVSVLCEGMVNSFRHVQHLAFNNANISTIQSEAFKQVPKLSVLSLAVNHLTTVKKGQFKNLQRLTVLYLSANQITVVEEDAFSELVNLRKIYLDKNSLYEVDSDWFLNNRRLSLINLAYNKLSKLQSGAFTLFKNADIQIRLQHNSIEIVEVGVVKVEEKPKEKEKPRLQVFMGHNNLTSIPQGFITSMEDFDSVWYLDSNLIKCVPFEVLEELKTTWIDLKITNNPLKCPCMQEITNFNNENTIKGVFEYTSIQECFLYGVQTPREWDSGFF